MEQIVKVVEFSKLRHAYLIVKAFVENESLKNKFSLETRLVKDLKIKGDDNYDLLVKFITKFELDNQGFQYDDHFHSEGELFGSEAALWNILGLSVWLPMKTIELITFGKVKVNKRESYKPGRKVTDMTFRELIIWYIEGKFSPSKEIKYKLNAT